MQQVFLTYQFDSNDDVESYLNLMDEYVAYLDQQFNKLKGKDERGIRLPKPEMPLVMGLLNQYYNKPHHQGTGRISDERLTIEEAIQAYTLNSAYACFEENIKGSITVGKLADIVILSDNLLKISQSKIKDVKILTTIFDGKIIYQR